MLQRAPRPRLREVHLYSAVRIVTVLHPFRIEGRQRFRKPFNDVYDFVHLHLIHGEHEQRHMRLATLSTRTVFSTRTRKRFTKLEM
ncbi:MAG: hypothetical protein ACRDRT_13415 [Pseudonocardiaceae bacterium]